MILQGKGGVGKSLVASLLCQYLIEQGREILAFDTDPVNQTLTGYKDLPVQELKLMKGDDIDRRRFDQLIEAVLSASDDVVVDNGAATFVPLSSYLKENQTVDFLEEAGMRVLMHTVFTGGQAMKETADGLVSLARHFPTVPLVVWLNRYFGEIATAGKQFEEFKVYRENQDQIAGLIYIPMKSPQTFGRDLEELFSRHQTFAQAAVDASLPVMTRQRLKIFWSEVCQAIDKTGIIDALPNE
ncbi:MAG: conjugal transfer protein TraL [Desulfobulbaceae bacterium]|nr:conjugal transfer protein TraL [Desulfobulbaceae bacterium]NQS71221.1 conjugal transfer protein TraL [Desulfobulbaceae bacterium]